MNTQFNNHADQNSQPGRESFSGRILTNRQFNEADMITHIMEAEIKQSGAFKDKLTDYSHAFARSQKFDTMKAENIIRDLFKERTGQTMNQMREGMAKTVESLTVDQKQSAYQYAADIGSLVEHGDKMSFHRAFAQQAEGLADNLGITDNMAKSLMVEEFRAVENGELFDWGKELDEQFYRPQIETEKQEREKNRQQSRSTTGRASGSTRTRGPELRR